MEENTNNNTFGEYLGNHFQLKLFWQILTDKEFGEKIIKFLAVDYFDDINFKKLFLTINQYYEEYEQIPNLDNKNIYHAIKKYNTNSVEEEILNEIINQIIYWNDSVLNQKIPYDGEIVQKETFVFIKQQEYRKISEDILKKVKTGEIKSKRNIFEIEDKFSKIHNIGDNDDYGVLLTDNIKSAFDKEFRKTIPTGILGIDNITGGGLGNGEVGIILAPSGVGKTTILTKISNAALEDGKNVLQIIFEDTEDEVRRKHFALWSKIPLSEMANRKEEAYEIVNDHVKKINNKLIIKKFDEDETTLIDVKNWIETYQKKFGFKFDMITLDYIDCLEPHKKAVDQNQAELSIIKLFISMASKYDIPMWTAVQGNRCVDLNTIVDVKDKGRIKIGKLNIGDEILTKEGYKNVQYIYPVKKQKTYKIKTKSGKEIICSERHKFPVGDDLKSIKTGLKVGDNLYVKDENVYEDEIVSIEEYDVVDTVDIMVEDTHMFFANDIYTHNSSFNAELVDQTQMGGNIKRAQKSHFLMSVAKNNDQKQAGLANISILKARFAQDGHIFKDCIFNNDTMEIRISGDMPKSKTIKPSTDTPDSLDDKLNKYSGNTDNTQQNKDVFNKDEIKDLLNNGDS